MSNISSDSYRPISCNFYDELEAYATLKQIVEINFWDENGHAKTVNGKIINLYTLKKVEFLELDSSLTIRLDQLIKVGDKELKNYC